MRLKSYAIAGLLLSQQILAAVAVAHNEQQPAPPNNFVVPSEISGGQPFTFAAGGVVEGEVITVETVEGEVIERKKPDKLGRVFLPAGLAAGTYLFKRSGGNGQTQCTIQPPKQIAPGPCQITSDPKVANMKSGLGLQGQGFSPDANDMIVTVGGKQVPVLAGTATELRTAPLNEATPGHNQVSVRNGQTGESDQLKDLMVYDLQAKLTRQKLTNGEQTVLEFRFKPEDTQATVNARIVSGPVKFAGGGTEQRALIDNGVAQLPLVADPMGMGTFRVAYDLEGIGGVGGNNMMNPPPQQDKKKEKCGFVWHEQKHTGWVKSKERGKFVAKRKFECYEYTCTKEKGHGGAHAGNEKRCKAPEKYTDTNKNGKWDKNDGPWTDKDGDKKPGAGEYDDADGDGKYTPPEPLTDTDGDGKWDGDYEEKHTFDKDTDRDKYIEEHP